MGKDCGSISSKIAIGVSVGALVVALCSYFCPHNKPCGSDCDHIKESVVKVIKNDPQVIMDAMGEGMARKREDAIKHLAKNVEENKTALIEMGMTFGNKSAKTTFIAFVDPLCKHCIEFQKDVIKVLKSGKNACFHILPVAVIGDDSVTLAKIYYAVYVKSPEKALSFIENIVNSSEAIDKEGIEKSLKSVGLSSKDIEKELPDGDKKVISNGKKAEELGVPFIPAVFSIVGQNSEIVKSPNIESMIKIIEGVPINTDSKNDDTSDQESLSSPKKDGNKSEKSK
jgi:protein-disulfide isomerase